MSNECTMPPEGWRCTRGAGHDGPCAAVPTVNSPVDWKWNYEFERTMRFMDQGMSKEAATQEARADVRAMEAAAGSTPNMATLANTAKVTPPTSAREAEVEAVLDAACRLYAAGVRSGHHDTVEGNYTDVFYHDGPDYYREEIRELLQDSDYIALTRRPARVGGVTGVLCGMTPGMAQVEFRLDADAIPEWLDFGVTVSLSQQATTMSASDLLALADRWTQETVRLSFSSDFDDGKAAGIEACATAIRELAARLPGDGWRTIESAPMDGTEILGYRDGKIANAYRIQRDDCESWYFGGSSGSIQYSPKLKPTHWQPLPPSPTASPAAGIGEKL